MSKETVPDWRKTTRFFPFGGKWSRKLAGNLKTSYLLALRIARQWRQAGAARGAGRPLMLFAQGDPQPTRFMFRDLEVHFYKDDLQLLGQIYQLVYPYRRRILNGELTHP